MAHYRAVAQAASGRRRIGVLLVNLETPAPPMRLAAKLEALLQTRWGANLRAILAVKHGGPSISTAIQELAQQHVDRLLVVPLYPQYCSTTTGSVFDAVTRVLECWRWIPETRFVNDYHDDPGYIDALAARIAAHWEGEGGPSHLVLSYHGMPARYVAAGDPYQAQAEATTRLVVARLGLPPGEYSHCYQSRFGRVFWLQPHTRDILRALAQRGVPKLTLVSPSCAVDSLDTRHQVATDGQRLTLVPALNDDDRHAALLSDMVERHLRGWIS